MMCCSHPANIFWNTAGLSQTKSPKTNLPFLATNC